MEKQNNQEVEKKKRSLKRYKKNIACIERLEKKLLLLDERIHSVKSPNYSSMPRGSTPINFDDLIADKSDLEDRIHKLKRKGRKLKREILAEIDTLDDTRYCEILESFLIDCQSLEDIAYDKGYTVRHVYRLYSEAVTILSVNQHKDDIT